jgi:hypothetical protein
MANHTCSDGDLIALEQDERSFSDLECYDEAVQIIRIFVMIILVDRQKGVGKRWI